MSRRKDDNSSLNRWCSSVWVSVSRYFWTVFGPLFRRNPPYFCVTTLFFDRFWTSFWRIPALKLIFFWGQNPCVTIYLTQSSRRTDAGRQRNSTMATPPSRSCDLFLHNKSLRDNNLHCKTDKYLYLECFLLGNAYFTRFYIFLRNIVWILIAIGVARAFRHTLSSDTEDVVLIVKRLAHSFLSPFQYRQGVTKEEFDQGKV